MNEPDLRIAFGCDTRFQCAARAAMEAALLRLGFDAEQAAAMVLAIDEAVANVIRHGYGDTHEGPIHVSLRCLGEQTPPGVEILIEDESPADDLTQIARRKPQALEPGGLGLNIIHEVMDEVEYTRRPEGGLQLRMCKGSGSALAGSEESS